MPTNRKSPFATSFNSCIKRGMPCWTAVQQISKRTGKSASTIFQSLFNAGVCSRQKINGQWFYWPTNAKKSSSSFCKQAQFNCMQNFMDWCIGSGFCTPRQFTSNCKNPTMFFNFLSKQWNNCWNTMNGSAPKASKTTSTSKKRTTTKSKSKSRKNSRRSRTTKAYSFPSFKSRKTSTSRRYRQAA